MAYYNYKRVRDQLPEWVCECIPDYEGNAGYDGDQWIAACLYIDFLEGRILKLVGNLDPADIDIEIAKANA